MRLPRSPSRWKWNRMLSRPGGRTLLLDRERDSKSKKKHEEVLASAKDSLERFYAEYNEKKSKAVAKNKEAESLLLKQDDASAGSNIWEKVVKQIELSTTSPSTLLKSLESRQQGRQAAKKPAAKHKDTSRLKSLLVSLKNDKNAPGNIVA
ncbi:clathrin light chain-domain-containing protein [Chytridium lagenaria]|nr:clathrin light chain-domain-containing protein [Chytridium lagenaria]